MNLTEVLSPKSKSDNEIYKKTEMYTISTIPKEILKTSGYIFDFTIPVIRNGSSLLKLNLLNCHYDSLVTLVCHICSLI